MASILPNNDDINTTPENVLKYLNPDGLRQLLRQERIRWNLKTNKDVDYIDKEREFKYTGSVHNNGAYQKMEIRSYPDNDANEGYAGVYVDSGVFGLPHDIESYDDGLTDESKDTIVNRVLINSSATIKEKEDEKRIASILCDPVDGRSYLYSNDEVSYVNNKVREPEDRIPGRAIARLCDVPNSISQLDNDIDMVCDNNYHHTDNNYTNSNRFILDNIDDRTFVYPEISKDSSGDFIENYRVGLNGKPGYSESDGSQRYNTQPDLGINPDTGSDGDRFGEKASSYNHNKDFSGAIHRAGYLPAIFRSVEELERVDLVDQHKLLRTHQSSPGGLRDYNYYIHDGLWESNWNTNGNVNNDNYKMDPQNPANMEISENRVQPTPYSKLKQSNELPYSTIKLYQWRYNRVDIVYRSEDIVIDIIQSGEGYKVKDKLVWPLGDSVITYVVDQVSANGQIQSGHNLVEKDKVYYQSPSTSGIGLPFKNTSSTGSGAKLAISCKAFISTFATQIKNNLFALVDVVPSVRSDNTTQWSDVNMADSNNGKVVVRSTAPGPAYSGINSGRGGPANTNGSRNVFYEHGGNASAGSQTHLFRYVIDTQNPTYVIRDGIKVYLGKWVDQGPLGVERPCDIKALLFSNPDCNNFNNYYKFNLDTVLDNLHTSPDETVTKDPTCVSGIYQHRSDHDPEPDQKFYIRTYDDETGLVIDKDITDRVLYINEATGVLFMYNTKDKYDPKYGYGYRKANTWYAIAGSIIS